MDDNLGLSQYGYAQQPWQGPYGYYEQQTPFGSFGAANQQQAQSSQAFNPYIGQQTQAPGQIGPVGTQYAGSNPYLGQTTQGVNYQAAQGAGTNAYAGANPYLEASIGGAAKDMTNAFNDTTNAQFDRQAAQSGSFGNTGVEAARGRAQNDLSKNIGNMASGARMQDYTAQQGLAENALNRTQGLNQFNAGNQLQAGMANSGYNAGDLSRNLAGAQAVSMFNAGQGNQMGQFNANLGLGQGQFASTLGQNDLNRNSNLAQSQAQFNAGTLNQNSQFNAGQGNALNQFNTGQANQMIQNALSRKQNQGQFDANMNFNTNQFNAGQQQQGFNNYWTNAQNLYGMNNLGLTNANTIQNTPLNYWQQFMQGANQAGGNGGTSSQNNPGNPLLGAIGGWQIGSKIFGG